ncbi:MAG: RNA polymerase sigma factor [Rhizomicrobium sp.]
MGGQFEPKRACAARSVSPARPAAAGVSLATASPVDRLYRKEAGAILLFVRRIVGNASDAEDIVQETFLRAWSALESGAIDCPRAFLFRAARNLAFNHVRNGKVRNSDAARTRIDEAFQRHDPTAEEQIIASEEAAACRRLLDELPARCREAFVLRVVDELSFKQMSKSMRLSVSTVEKHVGKGKHICRSLLTDPGMDRDPRLDVLDSRLPATEQARRSQVRRLSRMAAE